jgi:hypothetical protein
MSSEVLIMKRFRSIKRKFSTQGNNPIQPPQTNRNTMLVVDPDEYAQLGFCDRCTGVYCRYECHHILAISETRCEDHQHFPTWEVNKNYEAVVENLPGKCPACVKRTQAERKLVGFVRIRELRDGDFKREAEAKHEIFEALQRGLTLPPDEYEEEYNRRQEDILEKRRVRDLPKSDADAEIQVLRATIAHYTPQEKKPIQSSAPPRRDSQAAPPRQDSSWV